jgi:hypothetical protein
LVATIAEWGNSQNAVARQFEVRGVGGVGLDFPSASMIGTAAYPAPVSMIQLVGVGRLSASPSKSSHHVSEKTGIVGGAACAK